jgi:hypothetical protein
MTILLAITLIIALGLIHWVGREQADYERAHYDPNAEPDVITDLMRMARKEYEARKERKP